LPARRRDRLLVSGTKLRKWLSEGAEVPAEFSARKFSRILRQYYATIAAKDRVEVKLRALCALSASSFPSASPPGGASAAAWRTARRPPRVPMDALPG